VQLNAYALDGQILLEVEDRCGGLPLNYEQTMFTPFSQLGGDKSGLGLGLSIARQNVEAMGGTLSVRDLPEVGCVFSIKLPLAQ
jgi:signal transduction histidine kinase